MSAGSLQYARINATDADEPDEYDLAAFEAIQDSFIDTFGVPDSYMALLQLRYQQARIQADYLMSSTTKWVQDDEGEWFEAITRDESLPPVIDQIQKQIDKITKDNKGVPLIELKHYVDKEQGFHVKPKEITVYEYKSILNRIEEQAKRQQFNSKNQR